MKRKSHDFFLKTSQFDKRKTERDMKEERNQSFHKTIFLALNVNKRTKGIKKER